MLADKLGCVPGNANFFAISNDTEKSIQVIIDKRIMDAEHVAFHPMNYNATTAIKKDDIWTMWKMLDREADSLLIVDFEKLVKGEICI